MPGRPMRARFPLSSLAALAGLTLAAGRLDAQATTRLPERAVRRDIPITNAIRRAYAAGTRDSTGRPGRNYWQLRTDYTIAARLDAATSRLTGRETVTFRNDSPDSLGQIGLRLDPEHLPRQHAAGRAVGAGRGDRRDGDHAPDRERRHRRTLAPPPAADR